MNILKIFLKSGNILEVQVTNQQWTREKSKIISITWKQDDLSIIEELKFLDPERIEAITMIKGNDNAEKNTIL